MKKYIPFIGALLWFTILSMVVPNVWMNFLPDVILELLFSADVWSQVSDSKALSMLFLFIKIITALVFGALILWPLLQKPIPKSKWLSGIPFILLCTIFFGVELWHRDGGWRSFYDEGSSVVWTYTALFPGIWVSQIAIFLIRKYQENNVWLMSLLGVLAFCGCFVSSAVFIVIFLTGKEFSPPMWQEYGFVGLKIVAMFMGIVSITMAFINNFRKSSFTKQKT